MNRIFREGKRREGIKLEDDSPMEPTFMQNHVWC